MQTYSDKPNVLVTVNSIPSACNGDCTYTFMSSTAVPTLSELSIADNVMTIGLTDPTDLEGSVASGIGLLDVTIDGRPCMIVLNGLISSFTCTLPKNEDADETPILTAGDHYPDIYIANIGYAIIDKTVDPLHVDLNLDTITPNTGIANGGFEVEILGTGLPLNKKDITFTVCGQVCPIHTLTNIRAVLTIPMCS